MTGALNFEVTNLVLADLSELALVSRNAFANLGTAVLVRCAVVLADLAVGADLLQSCL